MVITPAILNHLFTSFKKHFQDGLKTAESQYKQIATVVPSSTSSNDYGWLGKWPRFREWVGARVFKSMRAMGYSIKNRLFESTVDVERTKIEDDQVGLYSPMFQELGKAAAVHPDELVFEVVKNGEVGLCYDGQPFFDDEHPVYPEVDGTGTPALVSNVLKPTGGAPEGPAWYLLATNETLKPFIYQERMKPELEARTNTDHSFLHDVYLYGGRIRGAAGYGMWQLAVKCTVPLTAENFEKARLMMTSMHSDGGRPLNIRPNLLLVPPELTSDAEKIVTLDLVNGSKNPNYKKAEIMESGWLNM